MAQSVTTSPYVWLFVRGRLNVRNGRHYFHELRADTIVLLIGCNEFSYDETRNPYRSSVEKTTYEFNELLQFLQRQVVRVFVVSVIERKGQEENITQLNESLRQTIGNQYIDFDFCYNEKLLLDGIRLHYNMYRDVFSDLFNYFSL